MNTSFVTYKGNDYKVVVLYSPTLESDVLVGDDTLWQALKNDIYNDAEAEDVDSDIFFYVDSFDDYQSEEEMIADILESTDLESL